MCYQRHGEIQALIHCWYESKRCSPFKSLAALQKMLEIVIVYDPAIPLVGIYPKEMKIYIYTKT